MRKVLVCKCKAKTCISFWSGRGLYVTRNIGPRVNIIVKDAEETWEMWCYQMDNPTDGFCNNEGFLEIEK